MFRCKIARRAVQHPSAAFPPTWRPAGWPATTSPPRPAEPTVATPSLRMPMPRSAPSAQQVARRCAPCHRMLWAFRPGWARSGCALYVQPTGCQCARSVRAPPRPRVIFYFYNLNILLHSVVDPDPDDQHQIERWDKDLDPNQRDKLDPDRHQNEKLDPDPYQFADKSKCMEKEPIWAKCKVGSRPDPRQSDSRIRIRIKETSRIRIKVIQIRNTSYHGKVGMLQNGYGAWILIN